MAAAILPTTVLLLALAAAMPAVSAASACESEMFAAGKKYATCLDLPPLSATLHWTYDAAASSLSVAFAAKPNGTDGWVSWGINPTGDGMKGAQTLLAFKQNGTFVVNTYNLTGYGKLGAASTPILYNPTELAADNGADGKVRLYGKLQLPKDMVTVNHIWNVGPAAVSGAPPKHSFAKENLDAKGSLTFASVASPPTPSGVKQTPSAAATSYASARVLVVLLALASFLSIA